MALPQLRHFALRTPPVVMCDGILDEDAGHARMSLVEPAFAAQFIAQRLHVDVTGQAGCVDRLLVITCGQLQLFPVARHLGQHQQMFGVAVVRA
ncbi:hypothetical protein D3C72_1696300 [compost metagenome]